MVYNVRSPLSPGELVEHFDGYVEVAQTFSPDPLPEGTAQRLLARFTTFPGYRQEQVRGAYREHTQFGGYRIAERQLCVGTARLTTGCVGGVYTRAEARNQGVATALMHDAIIYAREHDYPFLLLDGIPKFYHRYGYCDVYDLSTWELDRQAIMALPVSPYTVRVATLDDVADMLALYQRHTASCIGGFERTDEQQAHWMRHAASGELLLTVDSAGRVRGYLFLGTIQARGLLFSSGIQLWELAADDWSAAVALLKYHVQQGTGWTVQGTCFYTLPPVSPVAQWLEDHLEVPDISDWDTPVFGWAVREQTFRHRDAAWMARLVSLPALTRAMLPEWQARWRRSLAHWSGSFSLRIEDQTFTLDFAGLDLQLRAMPEASASVFSLTSRAFTQAVFGYRSISAAIQADGQALSADLATVLTILFPTGQTWIAPSDWF